ncbi:uncharacterized protein [Henckelia pumila]|uniref:uncharacterized protein n=1 Tax=Henckelia pumila TaxID=405737 RepID=UPI003C6DBBEE
MDKDWMSKHRLSTEYDIGVESFLKFTLQNADDPDAIPCPCAKCGKNELPLSLYDAKKSLRALGMYYVRIHACPNDCILYRKEYEDFINCPTCGMSRWKVLKHMMHIEKKVFLLIKAVLLWIINDFPAYGNMSGCVVKGYHACPICAEETYSIRLKHSRKISYTWHRRFLPLSHPYRRQKKSFDGNQEFNPAPNPLSGHEVLERVERINYRPEKLTGKLQSKKDDGKPCWKKKSIFFELEYWKHLHVRHILDVMHIEKNDYESLICTLLDVPGKTKDGVASRLDLLEMNMRTELAPNVGEKRTFLPPACYTLSYSSNFKNLVSMKDLKLVGLKSHDYHTLMQQLLPVAIRGILPKNVRDVVTRLCFFFNELYKKVINVPKLDELQREIVMVLCFLEKYFPPSFFDIMIHLTVHLVREIKLCGPVWPRHMYPFERHMKILKSYVRNRNRPEGCMAESYIAEEAVEFCSDYLSNIHTIGIPSTHHEGELTKPLSGAVVHSISENELQQAHRYVLANDVEIDPYIE